MALSPKYHLQIKAKGKLPHIHYVLEILRPSRFHIQLAGLFTYLTVLVHLTHEYFNHSIIRRRPALWYDANTINSL